MSGEVPNIKSFKSLACKIIDLDSDDTQPIEAIDAPVENFCRIFKNIKENREVQTQNTPMCTCHTTHQTNAINIRYPHFEKIYSYLRNYIKTSKKGTSDKVKELLNI